MLISFDCNLQLNMSLILVKNEFIMACRACLQTNVHLYNIHDNLLAQNFAQLTGTQVFMGDGLPQLLCIYCKALVEKFLTFGDQVRKVHYILVNTLRQQGTMTASFINDIQQQPFILYPNLSKCPPEITTYNYDSENYAEEILQDVMKIEIDDSNSYGIPSCEQILNNNDTTSSVFTHPITYVKCDDEHVIIPDRKIFTIETNHHITNSEDSDRKVFAVETNHYMGNNEEKANKVGMEIKNANIEKKCKTKTQQKKPLGRPRKKKRYNQSHFWFEDETQRVKFEKDYEMEVVILSKQKQIEDFEARKQSSNYLQSPFKCDVCYRGYNVEPAFEHHKLQHGAIDIMNRPLNAVCEICGVRFRFMCNLNAHLVSHKLKIFCKNCDFVNARQNKAIEHYKWHQGHKHDCEHCGKSFRLKANYYNHVRLLHPNEQLTCTLCGEGFNGNRGLHRHMRMHKVDEVLKKESDQLVTCGVCQTKFANSDALQTHTFSYVDGSCDINARPCTECGEDFADDDLLNKHLEQHKQLYPCDACDMAFPTTESRSVHIKRIHMNVRKKERDLRPKRFRPKPKQPKSSAAFKEKSEQPGVFMCEYCGKEFSKKSQVKIHVRQHTGDRPFQCNHCQKTFAYKFCLKYHVKSYHGDGRHQCKLCPKEFHSKANLVVHQRVHTGNKPFVCTACGKSFKHSCGLKLHVSTVHLNEPSPYKKKKLLRKHPDEVVDNDVKVDYDVNIDHDVGLTDDVGT